MSLIIENKNILRLIKKIEKKQGDFIRISAEINSLKKDFDIALDSEYGEGEVDTVILSKKEVILRKELIQKLDEHKPLLKKIELPDDIQVKSETKPMESV